MPAACEWAHRVGYKSVNANSLWRSGTVQRTRFLCPHTTACGVVRTLFESNLWKLKLVRSCAFFESNLEAPVRKVLFTHKTRTHQLRIIRAKLDIQVKKSGFLCLLFILATRETSFVHAISAAGVMYTLTKNCTAGDFDNCGCDDSKIGQPGKHVFHEHSIRGYSKRFLNWLVFLQRNNVMCYFVSGGVGWIWGGCSDNVAFGEKISKQFVDALEDGHDSRAAVNLHNNKAGRLVRFDLNIIDGFFFYVNSVLTQRNK